MVFEKMTRVKEIRKKLHKDPDFSPAKFRSIETSSFTDHKPHCGHDLGSVASHFMRHGKLDTSVHCQSKSSPISPENPGSDADTPGSMHA